MYALPVNYGPYIGRLQAFGPPEVVALASVAGNASVAEKASLFWEQVHAVCLELTPDATVADRLARLSWFAGDAVPFAQQQAPFPLQATHAGRITFAHEATAAGAANAATIVVPIPRLWLLPGWSVELDIVGGAAGDTVADVRVTRQRYELVRVGEYDDDQGE